MASVTAIAQMREDALNRIVRATEYLGGELGLRPVAPSPAFPGKPAISEARLLERIADWLDEYTSCVATAPELPDVADALPGKLKGKGKR